jgi:hypothetical protein
MLAISHPGRLLRRELKVRKLSANRLSLDIAVPSVKETNSTRRKDEERNIRTSF